MRFLVANLKMRWLQSIILPKTKKERHSTVELGDKKLFGHPTIVP